MSVAPTISANVILERKDGVARLTINRPPLNILDIRTFQEIEAQLRAALQASDVRLVEIRGAGEKAFSAGAEIRDHFPDHAPQMLAEFHALVRSLLASPVPTLAVVRGHCLGGGMELALACDFIIASRDARFGQPEIKLGAFPPVAAALLPRLVGEKKALEMILTGEPVTAEEALALGLVNRVADAEGFEDEVGKFTHFLLSQSARVLALARRATRSNSRHAVEAALREAERIYLDELLSTEDAAEGLRAFLEKRPPNWKGR